MTGLERAIATLVQSAPDIDEAVIAQLTGELRAITAPIAAAPALAQTIARVLELVAARRIDAGIALPPLAMAIATLADGLAGRLTARELEAARYEIDTLLPLPAPGQGPPIRPDVELAALTRPRHKP